MTDIPSQRLTAMELAVERYERAEEALIDIVREDPEAAEHFITRIREAGTRLPIVALGIRYAAQQLRFSPPALAERGIHILA